MRHWLGALFKETLPALVFVFGVAGTILTFVPTLGLGRLRWIAIASALVAFAWANFRIFQRLHNRLPKISIDVGEGWFNLLGPSEDYKYIRVFINLNIRTSNRGTQKTSLALSGLQLTGIKEKLVKALYMAPAGSGFGQAARTVDIEGGQTLEVGVTAEVWLPNTTSESGSWSGKGELQLEETFAGKLKPTQFSLRPLGQ